MNANLRICTSSTLHLGNRREFTRRIECLLFVQRDAMQRFLSARILLQHPLPSVCRSNVTCAGSPWKSGPRAGQSGMMRRSPMATVRDHCADATGMQVGSEPVRAGDAWRCARSVGGSAAASVSPTVRCSTTCSGRRGVEWLRGWQGVHPCSGWPR